MTLLTLIVTAILYVTTPAPDYFVEGKGNKLDHAVIN